MRRIRHWLLIVLLVMLVLAVPALIKACLYWSSDEVSAVERGVGRKVKVTWWDPLSRAEKVSQGTLERAYFRINDKWGYFDLCLEIASRGGDATGQNRFVGFESFGVSPSDLRKVEILD